MGSGRVLWDFPPLFKAIQFDAMSVLFFKAAQLVKELFDDTNGCRHTGKTIILGSDGRYEYKGKLTTIGTDKGGEYIMLNKPLTAKNSKRMRDEIDTIFNPPLWLESDLVPPITRYT